MWAWSKMRAGFLLVTLFVVAASCSGSDSFQGTTLAPGDVAPPFRLVDQFGGSVALSDFAGDVVVLAFLYTSCPDVCPIVTSTLRRTHELLGDDVSQVSFVAISVDPQRDSVERAHRYSKDMDMVDSWRFLVGSEEQLTPIWQSYWLDPVRDVTADLQVPSHDNHDEGDATAKGDLETAVSAAPVDQTYLVGHTTPVFLIDRQGYRRVLFTSLSLDSSSLVHDIRVLIK